MRGSALAALALVAAAAPALADGPVVITGTVQSNTLYTGNLAGVPVGTPVKMKFETTDQGGFEPFWGPTSFFCVMLQETFLLSVGAGPNPIEIVAFQGPAALVLVGSGRVTDAVYQDEMNIFELGLLESRYRQWFKCIDADDSVWTSPRISRLPHFTPASVFETKEWVIWDLDNPDLVNPRPELVVNFDGGIRVGTCRVDIDASGAVDVADIFAYLGLWFAGDPRAEFNGTGTAPDVADIFTFLAEWFRGC